MIASYPMYARPELSDALARFWDFLHLSCRDEGLEGFRVINPQKYLLKHWKRKDLFLSQACGAPFRDHLSKLVEPLGVADAGLLSVPAGFYQSVLISRDDFDPKKAASSSWAANDLGSQSGYYAPMEYFSETPLRKPVVLGSHAASIKAVQSGALGWAAIDAVTWEHAKRYDDLSRLTIWGKTRPTRGLPFITAQKEIAPKLRAALRAAVGALSKADKETLLMYEIVDVGGDDYL